MQQREFKHNLVYCLLILNSIYKVQFYTKDFFDPISFFEKDNQLHFNASLMLLENIGEQTSKMSTELKDKYPEIVWKEIIGVRNRIAHDYAGVDYFVVFNIIKKELPILQLQVITILHQELLLGNFEQEPFEFARQSNYYKFIPFEEIF
ncbi:MAG: HepT-like ribonuclease domain-containing protein [Saprospiraceae bacterium]|nr:HepT-like ribonuclease domain-containing protein [Saprospiraceae bacterium]